MFVLNQSNTLTLTILNIRLITGFSNFNVFLMLPSGLYFTFNPIQVL